jgi:hypothetical protein
MGEGSGGGEGRGRTWLRRKVDVSAKMLDNERRFEIDPRLERGAGGDGDGSRLSDGETFGMLLRVVESKDIFRDKRFASEMGGAGSRERRG